MDPGLFVFLLTRVGLVGAGVVLLLLASRFEGKVKARTEWAGLVLILVGITLWFYLVLLT
jgi:uncharacterized membrane protein